MSFPNDVLITTVQDVRFPVEASSNVYVEVLSTTEQTISILVPVNAPYNISVSGQGPQGPQGVGISQFELELMLAADNPSYFKTFTIVSGNLTRTDLYADHTMALHLFSKTFIYSSGNLTQLSVTRFSDGATLVKTFTYSGSDLISITATYTP